MTGRAIDLLVFAARDWGGPLTGEQQEQLSVIIAGYGRTASEPGRKR